MSAMSLSEYKARNKKTPPKKNKMGAVKKKYNGRTYDSTKEADYAAKLDVLKSRHLIKDWIAQRRFKLEISDMLITTYVLDFQIEENDGSFRYIDVKGRKAGGAYQTFKIKQKLMKAIFNITVEEV